MTISITEANYAAKLVLIVASGGILVSSLEWMHIIREFRVGGMYDWSIVKLRYSFVNHPYSERFFTSVCSPIGVKVVLVLRVLVSFWGIMFPSFITVLPLSCLVVTNLYLNFRSKYGLEGSDQMLSLICVSLLIGEVLACAHGIEIAIYFIAIQSVLSYFVAGLAKLYGPLWRQGLAVALIINTRDFGHSFISRSLIRFPLAGIFATYIVLTFECISPLTLFLPFPFTIVYVILGVIFHLLNAILMGLNVFVFAYVATYPAILFTASIISVQIY